MGGLTPRAKRLAVVAVLAHLLAACAPEVRTVLAASVPPPVEAASIRAAPVEWPTDTPGLADVMVDVTFGGARREQLAGQADGFVVVRHTPTGKNARIAYDAGRPSTIRLPPGEYTLVAVGPDLVCTGTGFTVSGSSARRQYVRVLIAGFQTFTFARVHTGHDGPKGPVSLGPYGGCGTHERSAPVETSADGSGTGPPAEASARMAAALARAQRTRVGAGSEPGSIDIWN